MEISAGLLPCKHFEVSWRGRKSDTDFWYQTILCIIHTRLDVRLSTSPWTRAQTTENNFVSRSLVHSFVFPLNFHSLIHLFIYYTEDGEMNDMTLPSRYMIRNSNPGGPRSSLLPLGHGGSPRGFRTRDLQLSKQAALTTTPGS